MLVMIPGASRNQCAGFQVAFPINCETPGQLTTLTNAPIFADQSFLSWKVIWRPAWNKIRERSRVFVRNVFQVLPPQGARVQRGAETGESGVFRS